MKVQEWQEAFANFDPEAEVILMFEGKPGERWAMELYQDMTQGEPRPLVIFLRRDPVDPRRLA